MRARALTDGDEAIGIPRKLLTVRYIYIRSSRVPRRRVYIVTNVSMSSKNLSAGSFRVIRVQRSPTNVLVIDALASVTTRVQYIALIRER